MGPQIADHSSTCPAARAGLPNRLCTRDSNEMRFDDLLFGALRAGLAGLKKRPLRRMFERHAF